ncbi:HNH endonuclease signature motif containing protein [Nocardioides ungokensis]|uniref:HNH endonuclease signature motif containing protein n=1 Tax=Nocardioides ungokensis TaxID=1643322 RepID=UPI0015DEBB57|nr:HNH endonuclease signature motif containing protein [Nocardioides ungokensis]
MEADLMQMDDHDLLAGGVADGVAEARAGWQRWARLVEFHRRREADCRLRHEISPSFTLTPRAQTVSEVSALWGLSESRVRHELNVALFLEQYFPEVWELSRNGQLDCYRAGLIADNARHALDDPVLLHVLARRVQAFLERHLSDAHGLPGIPPLVTCTPKQLRNKLTYELNRLRAAHSEELHRKAVADRHVRKVELPDGMAQLGISATVDQVRLADHRLTHAARQRRREGDQRTIAQLKSDLAIDLLTGREEGVPAPSYSRPIVNLTVPVQTVMGLADDPGVLAGGTVVPAGLARAIASHPDATWHRMLTDPAGRMVELSTTSYRPTDPIWRHVVAEWSSCFEPACDAPATEAEHDHRVPWPRGATEPANLWPACKRGHTTKHAPGFAVEQAADGSFRLRTAAGFAHAVAPPAKPVDERWPDLPEVQFSATEFLAVLGEIRSHRDRSAAESRELAWEHDNFLFNIAG